MRFDEALSLYFCSELPMLRSTYDWDFKLKNFPDKNYLPSGDSSYSRSRHVRDYIHKAICTMSQFSGDLQIWYVRDWGRVRGNKQETLELYIESPEEELFSLGAKGVASWSKILSVRNPGRYAIFDARVSIALNSLQYKFEVEDPILFPQLPSQNKSYVTGAQAAIKKSKFFSLDAGNSFYQRYLEILKECVRCDKSMDIQDAEMVLFSNAPDLSKVWDLNLDSNAS